MACPVETSPVKATLSTAGWPASAAPAVGPKPGRILATPSGRPASIRISPRTSAVTGVCSAGLRIMVQPAASAGASFCAAWGSGEFQGMIWPQTPIGSSTV